MRMRIPGKSASRVKALATVLIAWGAAAGLSVASMLAMAGTAPAPSQNSPAPNSAGQASPDQASPDQHSPAPAKVRIDRSGSTQFGWASFYSNHYSGRTMADGSPMRLDSNNAASLTLPLGTTARVTNLETGLSAIVLIEDRGPYVNGRIIDLSPATARKIGLARRQGLASVKVIPLTIPLLDGTVKIVSTEGSKIVEARHSRGTAPGQG